MKARKTRNETPEQKVGRWVAGSARGFGYDDLIRAGWEAGCDGHLTVDGLNYERFYLPGGGYVVVEWDADGDVCVL
jgi:hypothetical protein